MNRRRLITKEGTDPEVFKMIQVASWFQTIGTPEPNAEQMKDLLSSITGNELDFPRTSTSAQLLIELLKDGMDPKKVLQKARELIQFVKEDLKVPKRKK